jgi:cobalt-zinc-cadmium efflux system protein
MPDVIERERLVKSLCLIIIEGITASSDMHNHNHSHQPIHYDRAFKIGIALNLGFVLVQATFGFVTHSLALLADAGHNLGDVLGLLIAWGATWLTRRRANERYTYGFRRASIVSPLINSSLLLGVTGFIALEAIERLFNPQPIAGTTVMLVAAIGIVINGITAWMFHRHHQQDVNIKGAFLHMLADALVSAGVVVSGLIIVFTQWPWVDTIASIAISLIIAIGAWQLLQESLNLALDGVPPDVNLAAIQDYLLNLSGVSSIHDLHIWAMSSTEPALTVHLIMPTGSARADFLAVVSRELHQQFGIEHSTIQIETGIGFLPCAQSQCGA